MWACEAGLYVSVTVRIVPMLRFRSFRFPHADAATAVFAALDR
jgi:hypothetical protein